MAEWPAEWSRGDGESAGLARVLPFRGGRSAGGQGAACEGGVLPAPAGSGLRVLVPALLVLACWAATCLVDGVPGPLDAVALTAAALSPLAVVPAIAVVALALRARAWPVAALAAVTALVPWVFVLGYTSPSATGALPDGDVRVSALLLDADGGRADAPSVVAAVARQPVDLLVVTGATGVLAHDVTAAGLDPRLRPRWAAAPDPASTSATLVWSRYPVSAVETLPGVSSPAVRLVLETGRGPLTVVAGTAGASGPDAGTGRWRSDLAALGAAARGRGPVVLLGSLGATPQQAAFRRLTAGDLTDAAAALGRGPRPTWPSWSPLPFLPVDHVLVGGGVGVRAVSTLPVAGTSHRALVTSLAVPVAQAPPGTTAGGD